MIAAQLDLFVPTLVFCWGRCGGWGYRLADTHEVPCDLPGCLREHGHDAPHNPRAWDRK